MILEPLVRKQINKHTWHTVKEERENKEREVGSDYVAKEIISEDALRWMGI